MRVRVWKVLAAVAFAVACAEDEPIIAAGYDLGDLTISFDTIPPVRYVVRDSAGVQLIRNGREGVLPAESLVPHEIYRVGIVMGDQDYELWSINAIAIDAEGNRYVASPGARWIRVYDADGNFVREIGRHGQGPGEMLTASRMFLAGDTLVLNDMRLRRTTLFAKDGRVIDTWRALVRDLTQVWPEHYGPAGWIALVEPPPRVGYSVHENPDGSIDLIEQNDRPRRFRPLRLFEKRRHLHRLNPELGAIGDALFEVRNHPGYTTHEESFAPSPMFTTLAQWAFDAEGRFHVTRPTGYRIDIYDVDGRHLRGVTRDYRAAPISRSTVDEVKKRLMEHTDSMLPPERRRVTRTSLRSIDNQAERPLPPLFPPLGRLVVSGHGSFWVERRDAISPAESRARQSGLVDAPWPPLPSTWDLFDADARFLGQVILPPRFRLYHLDGFEATGVQRDSLGVEYIVTYRIGDASGTAPAPLPSPRRP